MESFISHTKISFVTRFSSLNNMLVTGSFRHKVMWPLGYPAYDSIYPKCMEYKSYHLLLYMSLFWTFLDFYNIFYNRTTATMVKQPTSGIRPYRHHARHKRHPVRKGRVQNGKKTDLPHKTTRKRLATNNHLNPWPPTNKKTRTTTKRSIYITTP